ncbi:MAG: fucose isomerase [Oscillospiraceae bacterium]|jgi:L-fucose isomerase-like protein|nr:fucose isomerase [Oscillospiraceae bacterium]
MTNMPPVKPGIVAVSRDCFPMALSRKRREAAVRAAAARGIRLYEARTIVESESDAAAALKELRENGVNALVLFLGNFGPEGPETYLVQEFDGPVLIVAAAEETVDIGGRGDAFCGLLNCSYNLDLRGVKNAVIPERPVGTAEEIAESIEKFLPVARALTGVKKLKIFGFGPRPYDFLACNAPIKPLYGLGVTVMENSELDLYAAYKKHDGDSRIETVAQDMARELGGSNAQLGILSRLAQYELTLLDFMEQNLGYCEFGVFANKCWPAFQTEFKFVPCYVNARLAARGIPVACETDIYGALSEYIITLVTDKPATLLDVNNTVPPAMLKGERLGPYVPSDLFMGFHCGNTAACYLRKPEMRYQQIMKRSLEPDGEPDITRGTLEGDLIPGPVTLFRLQANADGKLKSYIAQGEVLEMEARSFGAIGVIAVPELARFYRHVLIEGRFPHHAGVAFSHAGEALFETVKALGIADVAFNRPKGMLYPSENPFA